MWIVPRSMASRPAIDRSRVDLPADGPTVQQFARLEVKIGRRALRPCRSALRPRGGAAATRHRSCRRALRQLTGEQADRDHHHDDNGEGRKCRLFKA